MVPWSRIHILGRYTYYRSAAQAERRVARSLSKIAMQLTPSPAKNSSAGPGRAASRSSPWPPERDKQIILDPSRAFSTRPDRARRVVD